MKEHPILFTGEMVRAILEGRKTQTRRVMKLQPDCQGALMPAPAGKMWYIWPHLTIDGRMSDYYCACPYGLPGDQLWVRETFGLMHSSYSLEYGWENDGMYASDIPKTKPIGSGLGVIYKATDGYDKEDGEVWRPSIYMPRWASRITLEITGIRVQRVQQITNNDVLAEGIMRGEDEDGSWLGPLDRYQYYPFAHASEAYSFLWDHINAKRGYPWDSNPFVWVIEFKRIDGEDR